ncbi:MAG: lipid IV(A) 3-deoxy-D-manno-octulosonic acid transferase [Candidatus Nitrotoga sp.]
MNSFYIGRRFYTFTLWLLLPYVAFHLLWRARKQPEYLSHIGERFGHYTVASKRPIIWLHTVSVGETRAAANLIQQLQKTYPQHQLLLTHTTPTGRAASEQLYGNEVLRVYLPYDYPFVVENFLQHFKPSLGILLETEIWFNLIHACHIKNIPLLLLNARLSEKSAARYARFSHLTQLGLKELSAVAAQSENDAIRLKNLGATQVAVMGNLKFDIVPPSTMLELGAVLRVQWGQSRKIFLAASTRIGEEALLLQALQQINISNMLTVIVPRHPQRFNEVADLLTQRNIRFQRRSKNLPITDDIQVLLGDSMGEMFAYYAACDMAFIGGSLLPYGGQNLIEACSVGKPVLIGPHTFNFAQATEQAVECGAAVRVRDVAELAQIVQNLFNHPEKIDAASKAALKFVNAHRGATQLAMTHIAPLLLYSQK